MLIGVATQLTITRKCPSLINMFIYEVIYEVSYQAFFELVVLCYFTDSTVRRTAKSSAECTLYSRGGQQCLQPEQRMFQGERK